MSMVPANGVFSGAVTIRPVIPTPMRNWHVGFGVMLTERDAERQEAGAEASRAIMRKPADG